MSCTSEAKICKTCGRNGGKFCGDCKIVLYCSKDCQVKDWLKHKGTCQILKGLKNSSRSKNLLRKDFYDNPLLIDETYKMQENIIKAKEEHGLTIGICFIDTETLVCCQDSTIILGKARFPDEFTEEIYMAEIIDIYSDGSYYDIMVYPQ